MPLAIVLLTLSFQQFFSVHTHACTRVHTSSDTQWCTHAHTHTNSDTHTH